MRGVFLFVFLLGCGFDGSTADSPDASPEVDAGSVDDSALFDPDTLIEVVIDIPAADWDQLRSQSRNIFELLGQDCGTAPANSPFTYFSGAVTVDGQRVENVGVRKKGFLGSLDEEKPSLKIKFDEYVPGQKLGATKRMTLNNAKQDPSFVNQCLGYDLFRNAGVPSPRCNFAHVTVNGDDLGVFVHVENVKKPFLRRHFDDDNGNLYEGTLSDFRDGWLATFERKTNKTDTDRSDLDAVAAALAITSDANMFAEIDRLIDLDGFYRFWAAEVILNHWDGYSGNNNNFFMYNDPRTGKFVFMPWGVDQLFGVGDDGETPDPAVTRSLLTQRLFSYGPSRQAYLDAYQTILDDVWDDDSIRAEVDRMRSVFATSVVPSRRAGMEESLANLRTLFSGRQTRLQTELDSVLPSDAVSLADPLCLDEVGTATAAFDTTYEGSQPTGISMSIDESVITLTAGSVFAGPSDESPDNSVVVFFAKDDSDRDVALVIAMPDSKMTPGTLELGQGDVEAFLVFVQPGQTDPEEVFFVGGSLTMSAAAPTANAPFTGSVDLTIWSLPFQ